MADILKLQGNEAACTANTTVANSVFIRLKNLAGTNKVLTVAVSNAANLAEQTQYANLTMAAGEVIFLRKGATDTVQGTSVVASSIKIW